MKKKVVFSMNTTTPSNLFNTNLLIVVFNNSHMEEHTSSNPSNSIINYSLSFSASNDFTYTITQENFDNKISCNGDCN